MSGLYLIENVAISDTILTASNLTDTDGHAAYNGATTYALGDIVSVASVHKHYKSLQSGNTGNDPIEEDSAWWVEQTATNIWKPFDRFIADQAEKAGSIEMTIRPGEYVDTIAFYNLEGSTLQVVVTSDADGEVFNETYDLVSWLGIDDWYSYWFSPIEQLTERVVSDIPPYADTDIEITITGTTAKVGQIDLGSKRYIGIPQNGTEPSFKDFSYKEQDEFGRFPVVERSYSNRVKYRVVTDRERINYIRSLVANRRAKATTFFIPDTEAMGTLVYGYPTEFGSPLQVGATFFPLQIEGLT